MTRRVAEKEFTLNTEIVLEYQPNGDGGRARISAKSATGILHADVFDPANERARKRFTNALTEKCAGLDTPEQRSEIDTQLLGLISKKPDTQEPQAITSEAEIDVSHFVRPELFHTAALSGVAIPVQYMMGDRLVGRWKLFCRWHETGARETRELAPVIECDKGERFVVHPIPADPTPTIMSGWTRRARKAWLENTEAPNPVETWRRICEKFANFVEFPPDTATGAIATLAIWVILTYCFPAWSVIPYLAIGGPLESGKSTLFRVLSLLAFRSIESSNTTSATVFRTLHECGGVLLLDEAEQLCDHNPNAGELRSILLSGYKRGSPAMRLEKSGDTFQRREFDVFGPKAIAAIKSLPEALVSRSIRIGMARAAADSPKPRRRFDSDGMAWAELRDELFAIALEYGRTWIALAKRADACPSEIGGRNFEKWQPIFAIAGWLEEHGAARLTAIIRDFAAFTIDASKFDSIPDGDELLLQLLAGHVRAGTQQTLKAADLLKQAQDADPATFGNPQKPGWSPKSVSIALRRYGIHTHKGTGNTGRTYVRVTLADLRRIESTYGFELGLVGDDNVPQVS